jgi:WD repeat-containing protein 24
VSFFLGNIVWSHYSKTAHFLNAFVGDRPISRVPPTCFTIENLSPFQQGYGSLQIFSVSQDVPSSDDFMLTGLRRDDTSTNATSAGALQENLIEAKKPRSFSGGGIGRRIPEHPPDISFFVIDQGDLDDAQNPCSDHESIILAPEVLHVSRFADRYRFYIDEQFTTRYALCYHNASVADDLRQEALGHMWRSIAFMLEKVGEGFSIADTPQTVHQYVLTPTLTMLLEERANAGDVQTCVALCEIVRVVTPDDTVRLADLSVELVREWYLSYIDLLHGMCLFTQAAHLIKHSDDRFVNGLNQQSTTVYESCPHCGKGLPPAASMQGRRICSSCRKGVGMCFICHMPVRGNDAGTLYVWCPGCGHGGHLEHAIEWFGGINGLPPRNSVCPTGCGHRCNLFKTIKAFPRTDSLKYLDTCVIAE